jgi:hypothetical protein
LAFVVIAASVALTVLISYIFSGMIRPEFVKIMQISVVVILPAVVFKCVRSAS